MGGQMGYFTPYNKLTLNLQVKGAAYERSSKQN